MSIKSLFENIANAIKNVYGTTDTLTPAEMPQAIINFKSIFQTKNLSAPISGQTTVEGCLSSLSSDLSEYANVYGSKNLLNPSWDTHASLYGFSYTKNDNGQLVMSGSNTDSSLHGLQVKLSADGLVLEDGKKYIFSGGSEDPSKAYLQINYVSGGVSSHVIANLNTSDSVEITGNGYPITVFIVVRPGANVDGMIFEPMIRMASISDSTFVPYVPTNKQLFSDLSELMSKFTISGDYTFYVNKTSDNRLQFFVYPKNGTSADNGTLRLDFNNNTVNFQMRSNDSWVTLKTW